MSRIQELAAKYADQVIAYRRHMHMYPEVSLEEKETAKPGMLPEYTFELPAAALKEDEETIERFPENKSKAEKIFTNRYDFELYKMIYQDILQYAPTYERNALNKLF